MQFGYKHTSSKQKFFDNFIHFKRIFSNIIKIVDHYLIEFLDFFLTQAAHFDKCINLFSLVFLMLEFLFPVFLTTDSQQKFINNFICFKLITSNIIKIFDYYLILFKMGVREVAKSLPC